MTLFPKANLLLRSALLAAAIAVATPMPGNAATEFATVRANVIKPAAFAEVTGMNFGTIAVNGTAGQVSLTPDGVVTADGVIVADRDQVSSASLKLFGAVSQAYTISFPEAVTFSKGSDRITVSGFTHDAGDTPKLGQEGNGNLNIGATLLLTKRQGAGIYAGIVIITISNN